MNHDKHFVWGCRKRCAIVGLLMNALPTRPQPRFSEGGGPQTWRFCATRGSVSPPRPSQVCARRSARPTLHPGVLHPEAATVRSAFASRWGRSVSAMRGNQALLVSNYSSGPRATLPIGGCGVRVLWAFSSLMECIVTIERVEHTLCIVGKSSAGFGIDWSVESSVEY